MGPNISEDVDFDSPIHETDIANEQTFYMTRNTEHEAKNPKRLLQTPPDLLQPQHHLVPDNTIPIRVLNRRVRRVKVTRRALRIVPHALPVIRSGHIVHIEGVIKHAARVNVRRAVLDRGARVRVRELVDLARVRGVDGHGLDGAGAAVEARVRVGVLCAGDGHGGGGAR